MKKLNALLLVLLSLNYGKVYAQIELTIPFDKVKDRTYTIHDKFKHGEKYVIKITDINRHLFKVDGTVGQKDFNIELPSIFGSIKLPGFATLQLPVTEQILFNSTINDREKMTTDSVVDEFFKFEDPINTVEKNYEYLQKTLRLSNTIKALLTDCNMKYSEIESVLMRATNQALGLADSPTRAEQEQALNEGLLAKIEEARQARGEIEAMQEGLLNMIQEEINSAEKVIYRWSLNPTKSESRTYRADSEEYIKAQLSKKEAERRIVDVKSSIERVLKMIEELEKLETDNKIQILVDSYNRINESNFTYISEPIKISKDETELKYIFKADTLLTCDYPSQLYIQKTTPTVGGIKIDFSTGVFVSGRLKNNKNYFFSQDLYYLNSTKDSTTTIQDKDQGTQAVLSIGALAHIYWRVKGNFNIALSPGVSTTTTFDSFLFHLGLSTTLGKKERLVITVGTTFKESLLLDKRYEVNRVYKTAELPKDVPTIKVFPKTGIFFALTYNLSSLRKPKE